MPFSAIKAGHIFTVSVTVQRMTALEALAVVAQPRPHPLVTLMDMVRVTLAVVARADVITRQVMLTAHPTGSGGRGSEQTQSAEALVEAIALG